MLQAALAYAANGWQVFPVPPGDKKSYKAAKHSNGRRWGATTDAEEIKADWRKWPDANIGLPTGPETGFFVVEADTIEGHGVDGIANLRALEAEHGALPPTRMAQSPSGSLHHYFRWPTDGRKIKNSAGALAPGVDVRGEGGMVVAPPSVRPGKGAYQWLNQLPMAEAPPWLVDLIVENEAKPEGGARWDGLHVAALRNLEAWVPELFGEAAVLKAGTYRISSKALGRDLEEDLVISPKGIKDFGLHDQGDPREGRRTPVDLVMEYGGLDRAQAIAWLRDRLGIPEGVALDDFHAYMPTHQYIFAPNGDFWTIAGVNARLPAIPVFGANGEPVLEMDGRTGKPKLDKRTGKPKQLALPPSMWLDRNKPVEAMSWAPGLPALITGRLPADGAWIDKPGATCFNLYRPPPSLSGAGDADKAQRYTDLIERLFGAEATGHILNYCAFKVQFPHIKINHGLLLIGKPGIGKDTIIEPVKFSVGHWNFREASPVDIMGRWNDPLRSVFLRINEIHDLGDIDRYAFYERTKGFLAAPPDTLRIDEKFKPQYYVANVCGTVMTSNHKTDGLYLPESDRRHYVAASPLTAADFPDAFWRAHWHWYCEEGGLEHAAALLHSRDVSAFDPAAPPVKTAAFWDIVHACRAPEDAELADTLDRLGQSEAKAAGRSKEWKEGDWPLVVTLSDLKSEAQNGFFLWLDDRRNRRTIPHRLEQAYFEPCHNPDADSTLWVIQGKRQVVYVRTRLKPGEQLQLGFGEHPSEEQRLQLARKHISAMQ
jgi:hypothetical protein